MSLWNRLKYLWPARRRAEEREMREELESLAALAGPRELGNLTLAMENARATWGWTWLDGFLSDLRYAFRALAHQPALVAVAVLSLALAIGANSAIFSFADALLLRPPAVPHANALYDVVNATPDIPLDGMSFPDYRDFERRRSFSGMTAYRLAVVAAASDPAGPARIRLAALVSGNYFPVVGVTPSAGRAFRPEEANSPGQPVALISYDFWRDAWAGRPPLGAEIRVNGVAFTVVGVTPEGFDGLDRHVRPSIYLPLGMAQRLEGGAADPLEDRGQHDLIVKGRLSAGVTRESAQAELAAIAAGLEREYPKTNRNRHPAVRTELARRILQTPQMLPLIRMLMGLVALILVIACSNLANLLLARGRARAREIAIRLSIGAGRGRLVRQLMTESLLLALAGGAAGLVVGYGGILLLGTLSVPSEPPTPLGVELDWRTVEFSFLAAFASCLFFGLAPAWQAVRLDFASALKAGGAVSGARRTLGRDILVAGQIALAMVVLVAASLFLAGFRQMLVRPPDFRIDHLITLDTAPDLLHYPAEQTKAFYKQLADRVRATAGVTDVALTESLPLAPAQSRLAVTPEGYQFPKGRESTVVFGGAVDSGYFRASRVEILRGRAFTDEDRDGSRRVAIVNQQFADRFWRGQDPIGKRLRAGGANGPMAEVVGVARTGHYFFVNEAPSPYVYLPFEQNPRSEMTLIVESAGDPAALAAPLREAVRAIDPDMPVFNLRPVATLYESRASGTWMQFFQMVGTMGFIGLLLAMTGLYGLIAYTVNRRVKEFGIRVALGASRKDVVWLVERRGLILAALGIVLGTLLTIVAVPWLGSAFLGLGQASPAICAPVALGLLAVSAAASYLPARRAAGLDPLRALRDE